jgi:proline dehydrogenase
MLIRSTILRLSAIGWVERFIRRSWLTRGVVSRFIAGETLDQALAVTENLAAKGFRVTLDMLGENSKTSQDADSAAANYEEMLRRIAESPHSGGSPERINISIKLTQLGLLTDPEAALGRLGGILEEARKSHNFVRIDMEDSGCTERTLGVATRAFTVWRNVGVALQAMLFRTEKDVKELDALGMRIRLVKGAYLESAEVALQAKREVDEAYVALGKELLLEGTFPAFGTHDSKIIDVLKAFSQERGIGSERFEFQFLYGIRRDLQERLRNDGYGVRIYVPYGDSWYPYFTRRLAERPANLLFFIRSLFGK